MIETAAPSARIGHVTSAPVQQGPAADRTLPAGFATVLALSLQAEPIVWDEAAPGGPALAALVPDPAGKTGGKTTGKILPDGLPDASPEDDAGATEDDAVPLPARELLESSAIPVPNTHDNGAIVIANVTGPGFPTAGENVRSEAARHARPAPPPADPRIDTTPARPTARDVSVAAQAAAPGPDGSLDATQPAGSTRTASTEPPRRELLAKAAPPPSVVAASSARDDRSSLVSNTKTAARAGDHLPVVAVTPRRAAEPSLASKRVESAPAAITPAIAATLSNFPLTRSKLQAGVTNHLRDAPTPATLAAQPDIPSPQPKRGAETVDVRPVMLHFDMPHQAASNPDGTGETLPTSVGKTERSETPVERAGSTLAPGNPAEKHTSLLTRTQAVPQPAPEPRPGPGQIELPTTTKPFPAGPGKSATFSQPATPAIDISANATRPPDSALNGTQPAPRDQRPPNGDRPSAAVQSSLLRQAAIMPGNSPEPAVTLGLPPISIADREIAAAELALPRTAEAQHFVPVQDGHSLGSITSGAQLVRSANPAPTGPHDFAALVDRLIEARDTAVPQSIRASIAHAEFGQISLRLQPDDGGFNVSMRSADPGFAPAAQAAAAASASSGSDENGSSSSRHDGQGQQTGGTASGQSQSHQQASSQSTERDSARPATRQSLASDNDMGRARQGESRQRGHDGIYA